jgi:hypothetical protein
MDIISSRDFDDIRGFVHSFFGSMAKWETMCAARHKDMLAGDIGFDEFQRLMQSAHNEVFREYLIEGVSLAKADSFSQIPTYDSESVENIDFDEAGKCWVFTARKLPGGLKQNYSYEVFKTEEGVYRLGRRRFFYLNDEMNREWVDAHY